VDAVVAAGGVAEAAESPTDAVRRALEHTAPGDTVVVTGSFLILGAVADALAAIS
jgi:folylpolyglutamate synthase/dihydropteroate synthase